MALRSEDEETAQLARAIARRTGESPAQAIIVSLRERLGRLERSDRDVARFVDEVMAIGEHCASLPIRDSRTPDELLGYDEHGLPH